MISYQSLLLSTIVLNDNSYIYRPGVVPRVSLADILDWTIFGQAGPTLATKFGHPKPNLGNQKWSTLLYDPDQNFHCMPINMQDFKNYSTELQNTH